MSGPSSLLVTHRRGFLVRAFGITAAGASVAVPVLAVASPLDRVEHHARGLEAAFRDLYPGAPVRLVGTYKDPVHLVDPAASSAFAFVVAGPLALPWGK